MPFQRLSTMGRPVTHSFARGKRHAKWKDIAAVCAPPGLPQIVGFHDETLSDEWKGYRSSCLCRVIGRALAADLLFQVVAITGHDDRRS